ncbi:MAG: DUF4251 domain-containing protein [Prolixibacteraceae bacterium]
MKRLFILLAIVGFIAPMAIAQNKKAEKEAAAKAQYDKAVAAIESKDFVIIVETYESSTRTIETNTDVANFLSFEKDFVFLQGFPAANSYTNKLEVSEYKQETDKKGNLNISMQVKGFYINARIEIFMKKGGNYADVIVSHRKEGTRRFSGEVVPKSQSKYFKRPGEV